MAKSSKLDSDRHGGGVMQSDSLATRRDGSTGGVVGKDGLGLPTLRFCSVANDSLIALIASKNLVQEAKATGMGLSISYISETEWRSFPIL